MQQGTTMPQATYLRTLAYLRRLGALPQVGVATVDMYHDPWCAHFQGRRCDGAPEGKVRWTQPAAAQH